MLGVAELLVQALDSLQIPRRVEAAGGERKEAMNANPTKLPLGEQMDVLREVYGVYEEPVLI